MAGEGENIRIVNADVGCDNFAGRLIRMPAPFQCDSNGLNNLPRQPSFEKAECL